VLNAYGVGLLCVAELYFKEHEGDPSQDPSTISQSTLFAFESLAGAMLLAALAMWLYDLPRVVRGTLVYKEEVVLFWSALLVWMMPTGFFFGLHFVNFGRPLDWQLYSSLITIATITGIAARNYAAIGQADMTYLLTLTAGISCFGINLLRWAFDGLEFRRGSFLHRQLRDSAFERARVIWLLSGLLCSGHQWHLGHRIATFQTVLLYCVGIWLLLTAQLTVAGKGSAGALEAVGSLRAVALGFFALMGLLWLHDGALLFLGKINLAGKRLDVLDEEDDDGPAAGTEKEDDPNAGGGLRAIVPPVEWRPFKTHLGTIYHYDPATEMVHFLSVSGKGNYAIDPVYNCTVAYDSLEHLAEQMQRRGFGPAYYGTEAVLAPPPADAPSDVAPRPCTSCPTTTTRRRKTAAAGAPTGTAASTGLVVDQQV